MMPIKEVRGPDRTRYEHVISTQEKKIFDAFLMGGENGRKRFISETQVSYTYLRPIYLHTTKYIYAMFCLVIMWLRKKI